MFAKFDSVYTDNGKIIMRVKRAGGCYLLQLSCSEPIILRVKHRVKFRVPLREFRPCRIKAAGKCGFYHIVTAKNRPVASIFWLGNRRGGAWHLTPLTDKVYIYDGGTYLYLQSQV